MCQDGKRNHVISRFYLKEFSWDIDDKKRGTDKKRVYVINKKNENTEAKTRKIDGLCIIRGYNSKKEECEISKLENLVSVSLKAVIKNSFKPYDIENIKILIAYFLANQPSLRTVFNKLKIRYKESKLNKDEEKLKRIDGTVILMQLFVELLSKWNCAIYRIKENEQDIYITSDNPIHSVDMSIMTKWFIPNIEEINRSTNKIVFYELWRTQKELRETPHTFQVPEDTVICLPLNPKTAIYLYQNEEQKKRMMKDKIIVSKMNYEQIKNAKKYVISNDKQKLEQIYLEYKQNGM